MTEREFTITEEHLKLLRAAYVSWDDCEYGAPEIDPKRPYGNSSVVEDIHEILTGESAYDDDGETTLTTEQAERYKRLHRETETALQIVLVTGLAGFEPGPFVVEKYTKDWKSAL